MIILLAYLNLQIKGMILVMMLQVTVANGQSWKCCGV